MPVGEQDRPRADAGERLAPTAMRFASVHQSRIDTERHVVQEDALIRAADVDAPLRSVGERAQGADRIVAVEAEVAREVVTGTERDADERGIAFERNLRDRRQRAVASGHAQEVGRRGPGHLRRILVLLQDVGLDTDRPCLGGELVGGGRALAGTRIDEKEGGHDGHPSGTHEPSNEPFGPWRRPATLPIFRT